MAQVVAEVSPQGRIVQSAPILEMMVQGKPLAEILVKLVASVEAERPGMICSILLLDTLGKHLLVAAAPSLPTAYNAAIHGLAIGPQVGSCGTAAYTGNRVIASDIATHPYWKLYRHLALEAGLASCWSEPILSANQRVLGTFAIYHTEPTTPREEDLALIQEVSRLAAIAIERARTEEKLRLFQRAWDDVGVGIVLVEATALSPKIVYVNPAFEKITDYSALEVVGEAPAPFLGETGDRVQCPRCTRLQARKDGTTFWNDYSYTPVRNDQGEVTHFVGIISDISQQKSFADALIASESRYRQMVETAEEGIWVCDSQENTLMVNAKACQILGYTRDELVGQSSLRFIHEDERGTVAEGVRLRQKGDRSTYTTRFRHKQGQEVWVQIAASPILNPDGSYAGSLAMITDITERRLAQAQIAHNALHDPLTDLPNRTLLMERLQQALQQTEGATTFALLFLDLDRFKVINDSMGHLLGDDILRGVAQILRRHLRPQDLVARFGGDEFVILLEEVATVEKVLLVAERILRDFGAPFLLHDTEMFVTASIGVVLGSPEYKQADEVIRDADIAMYRAKGSGGGTYRLFDSEMHAQAVRRLEIETDLRKALEREDFVLFYQPILDLRTGWLWGVEALVRLAHPQRGLIPPGEFIPVAEETGLIVNLDHWVLRQACAQLQRWNQSFPEAQRLKISVNICAPTLRKPGFLRTIDALFAEFSVGRGRINLELTESVLLENSARVQELFSFLRERDIPLSIDDFGTGFSSLSYLQRFPIDTLKVDRSFVNQMHKGDRDYQLISTIVALSNQLGFEVVAEGVETEEQLGWLKELGCEYAQGYYFAQPLPVAQLEQRFLGRSVTCGATHQVGQLRKAA